MDGAPAAVMALGERLRELGWVRDLLVAGSLAMADHVPGVSDCDLVAVVEGRLGRGRVGALVGVHRELDIGAAAGADLGCAYVEEDGLGDHAAVHPTWTHGRLVDRNLSGITRAELLAGDLAVFGRSPSELLAPMPADAIRNAAQAEVCGYWAWASRRPSMWVGPAMVDLSLTSMARARYAVEMGRLLSKSSAIDHLDAPSWLSDQVRARRRGEPVTSPRLRSGWVAWRDARRTIRILSRAG